MGTIASSPIETCTVDDDPEEVLARPRWLDFDVLPVMDDQRIVAVIERSNRIKRPLHSGILVSSSQPLEDFLTTSGFVDDGYRLVLFGSRIAGIVTPSDLLRLPVRVLAFALLSHLEHTMNRIINADHSEPDGWLKYLKLDRKAELEQDLEKLQQERLNPDLLEFTYLSEKINILKKSKRISNAEAKSAGGLNELRHQVAHNRDYARDQKELQNFLGRMQRIRALIAKLESRITSP